MTALTIHLDCTTATTTAADVLPEFPLGDVTGVGGAVPADVDVDLDVVVDRILDDIASLPAAEPACAARPAIACPIPASVRAAGPSRFARERERVAESRARSVVRINLAPPAPLRRGHTPAATAAPHEPPAHDAWAEPFAEDPERWDGLS